MKKKTLFEKIDEASQKNEEEKTLKTENSKKQPDIITVKKSEVLPPKQIDVIKKIQTIKNEFNKQLLGRSKEFDIAMLSLFSGNNMFLYGPPGEGKTAFSKLIAKAVDGVFFNTQLHPQLSIENIFGNTSIKELKENDRQTYITEGYLPEADIAFLDEIWKASPDILNSLLTIVESKEFHNYNKVQKVPLKMMISASNEFPQDPSLNALYDRFAFRLVYDYASPDATVEAAILSFKNKAKSRKNKTDFTFSNPLTIQDLKVIANARDNVQSSKIVEEQLAALIKELRSANINISTRKAVQFFSVLATNAALNNRNKILLKDFEALKPLVWDTLENKPEAEAIVDYIAKLGREEEETTKIFFNVSSCDTNDNQKYIVCPIKSADDGNEFISIPSKFKNTIEILLKKHSDLYNTIPLSVFLKEIIVDQKIDKYFPTTYGNDIRSNQKLATDIKNINFESVGLLPTGDDDFIFIDENGEEYKPSKTKEISYSDKSVNDRSKK